MFIALICIVKTIIDFSRKRVFPKKTSREHEKGAKQKHRKKKYDWKFMRTNVPKNTIKDMHDTATSRRIEDYDCAVISRKPDYNSNTYEKDDDTINRYSCGVDRNLSHISNISPQDADFVQDTSDYQWFADYSLRGDSISVCSNMYTSILSSSLCTSYGYNDMARDLDANLAQVDMEDFRTEDIHSFLNSLPRICDTDVHNEKAGEMIASVSGSMMKYDFNSSLSPRSISQEDSSNGSSIYKSEILFSPVKEVPLVSFSIDSLDCSEHDIILTCQANKDNYTIAFEGSTLMDKSTDVHCPANGNMANVRENRSFESVERMSLETTSSKNSNSAGQIHKNFMNKLPLICSESPYITWSKLKGDSDENILKRQSSGNNNTNAFSSSAGYSDITAHCAFLKSQSLPNLNPVKRQFILSRRNNNSVKRGLVDQQTYATNKFVKIYNLSRSQCGRKIHRSVFQNNINFDLISQFINHKHVVNAYKADEYQNLDALNSKFGEIVENLNESSSKFALPKVEENQSDYAPGVNKDCYVFQDSLVSNRNNVVDKPDMLCTSNSCISFSSHTGNVVDLTKMTNSSQTRVEGLPTSVEKIDSSYFLRNRYFDSAKNFRKEIKKRKLVKKCPSSVKPITIMDRSMQTSSSDADNAVSPTISNQKSNANSNNKPVYVMYPNYTLPDLSFLQQHATELDLQNVFLWPQKFSPSPTSEHAAAFNYKLGQKATKKKRPCSCPDLDSVKNKDYQHIRDWESLIFLLPREYSKILTKDPKLHKYAENLNDFGRSLICTSAGNDQEQCEYESKTIEGSTCSNGTQPSSGYRGSSTMLLTDSAASVVKCENQRGFGTRPPLPKGILRNPVLQNIKSKKNMVNTKRYSMFEWRDDLKSNAEKRRSLPSQLSNKTQMKNTYEKECNYSEDEGVDSSGSHCDSPGLNSDQDAKRLECLLQTVFHWSDIDGTQSKNQNSKKTVSFADRQNRTPPNSPNSSILTQQKSPYQMKLYSTFDSAIHEKCKTDKHGYCGYAIEPRTNLYNFKKELIKSVEEATQCIMNVDNEEMMTHFALNQLCPALYAVLNLGLKPNLETAFGDIGNSVWQVVEASSQQGVMTRALHELVLRLNNEDVLTEGLLKFNAFIFGLLNVRGLDAWFSYLRTRESVLRKHYTDTGILLSSCRGIMSDRQLTDQLLHSLRPLSDFTFKLDLLYECRQLHNSLVQLGQNSPVQSNSTRTSWVLKKIMRSLQNVNGNHNDEEGSNYGQRPRSCVDSSAGFSVSDIASTVRRRWSGIQFGSKLASAFERLDSEEDETYTDSLDHAVNQRCHEDYVVEDSVGSNTINDLSITYNEIYDPDRENDDQVLPVRELKFKQLQKKWERLAEKQSPENLLSKHISTFTNRNMDGNGCTPTTAKSRIPRLVTSPVRPPTVLNFSVLPANRMPLQLKQPSPTSPSSISTAVQKKTISPQGLKHFNDLEPNRVLKMKNLNSRSSRIDQNVSSSHVVRPNSLPQMMSRFQRTVVDDQKRPSSSGRFKSVASKYVRTLGHRLPSDTGHLSYNEGEKLRVVLEVDDKWILCCRRDQKGLVPRAAVLPISGHL